MIAGSYNIVNDKWLGDWALARIEMGQSAEDFYWENIKVMDREAEASYLRALKIPDAFFQKLDDEAQHKVIHSQTQSLLTGKRSVEALWVLIDKEKNMVVYASKVTDTAFGAEPPTTFFREDKEHWTLYNVDRVNGTVTFMRILEDDAKEIDKFYPVAVVTFSILYDKKVVIKTGMFKPMSSAFLIKVAPGTLENKKCSEYEAEELQKNIAEGVISNFKTSFEQAILPLVTFAKDKQINFDFISTVFSTVDWAIKNKFLRLAFDAFASEYAKKKDELTLRVRTLEQFIDYCFVDVYTRKHFVLKAHLALGEALLLLVTQLKEA